MTYKEFKKTLVDAGLMTKEKSNIIGPVTLGGSYEAENGFFYDVFWDSRGFAKTSKEGKKHELLVAERESGYNNLDEFSTEEEYQNCYQEIFNALEVK